MRRVEKLLKNKFMYTLYSMVKMYYTHRIGRRSAELAYYLLFAMFPLMIFVTIVLAEISIDMVQVETLLVKLIPRTISELICDTLEYIRSLNSDVLMYTGLVTSVYAVFRAVTSLVYSVNLAYDEPSRRNIVIQALINLGFSILLLAFIVFALVIVIANPTLVTKLSEVIRFGDTLMTVWNYTRFIIIAGMFLVLIELMYCILPNRHVTWRQALPGTIAATVTWVAASIGFSFYVNNMSRYTLLYGSIGAIIILLLWLYLTGVILIMGAELNGILIKVKNNEFDHLPRLREKDSD